MKCCGTLAATGRRVLAKLAVSDLEWLRVFNLECQPPLWLAGSNVLANDLPGGGPVFLCVKQARRSIENQITIGTGGEDTEDEIAGILDVFRSSIVGSQSQCHWVYVCRQRRVHVGCLR